MISITVKDGFLFTKSQYDQKLVEFMRSRPKRFWNTQTREWRLPEDDLGLLLEKLEGYEYTVTYPDKSHPDFKSNSNSVTDSDKSETVTKENNGTPVIIKDVIPKDFKFKTRPYKHQLDAINYGLQHPKFLLADSPGLGKTLSSLDIAKIRENQNGLKHVLIITCVNSLKYNWQSEVGIHTDDKGYIIGTRVTKTGHERIGSNEDRLEDIRNIGENKTIDDCFFLITNIETLRYTKTIQVPLKTKKNGVQRFKKQTVFPIIEALNEQIKNGNIGMIICDEMHRCLAKGTKVQTDCGLIPIEEIVENKSYLVKTMNLDGSTSFVKPVNYFKNPIETKMIKLNFLLDNNNIKTVVCTQDHKFLTKNRGYIRACDLLDSDEVVEVD